MSKQRNKSRPISFRVGVERYTAVSAAAARAGLSIGKWAESLTVAALEAESFVPRAGSGEEEAYTAPDWRDAQLPPGDRADSPDDPLVPAHSGGFIAPQEPMYDITGQPAPRPLMEVLAEDTATQNAAFSEELQHNSGHTATHEQETTSGRTDDRHPVDQDDGESSDDLPGESEGGGPLAGGVSGQDHPGVSDQGDDCPECAGTGLLNPEIDGTACPACGIGATGHEGEREGASSEGSGDIGADQGGEAGNLPDQPGSGAQVGRGGDERVDPALPGVRSAETAERDAGSTESRAERAVRLAEGVKSTEADRRRERFEAIRDGMT